MWVCACVHVRVWVSVCVCAQSYECDLQRDLEQVSVGARVRGPSQPQDYACMYACNTTPWVEGCILLPSELWTPWTNDHYTPVNSHTCIEVPLEVAVSEWVGKSLCEWENAWMSEWVYKREINRVSSNALMLVRTDHHIGKKSSAPGATAPETVCIPCFRKRFHN